MMSGQKVKDPTLLIKAPYVFYKMEVVSQGIQQLG